MRINNTSCTFYDLGPRGLKINKVIKYLKTIEKKEKKNVKKIYLNIAN